MLTKLLTDLSPTISNSRIAQIHAPSLLAQRSAKETTSHLGCVYALNAQLGCVTLGQLSLAFVITTLGQESYSGAGARYSVGNLAIKGATLAVLKCIICNKVEYKKIMGPEVTVSGGVSVHCTQAPAPGPTSAPTSGQRPPISKLIRPTPLCLQPPSYRQTVRCMICH